MKKKIAVIGCPGGGKSYFSSKLSKIIEVPVYHMDNIYWHENKTHIAREELIDTISTIMDNEVWIIDGNYISSIEQRIQCAEIIIYLDFTTEQCMEGIKNRIGIKRDDMPWMEETLDEELLNYVVMFKDETKPRIEEFLEKYKDKKVIRFITREEMNVYLSDMLKGASKILE
jgi:adenylate kinase family enzyme